MESIFQQLIGQTIDRYKIISILGEGGMGAVLKGYDVTLQREVAVKMMHPHLAGQPNFQERFLQEARTAARLDHANIVQVYTFGQFRSMLYIIMKFIPGDNLEQMLEDLRAEKSWLVLREALEIIRQVSLAMDYAHRSGVLHRDLKPSNIMIEPVPSEGLPYRPVVTDLGLAKLASGTLKTMEGTSMGTPAYMSPEQALGKETNPCSDVYSLGIMLYELCTGRLPFKARTLPEAIQAHVNQAPPSPRSIRPDLPEALEAVILKALEKDPAQRYQNASELAQAVQSVPLTEITQASPTAMESAISLITQYKKSLEKPRGPSLLEEFKTPPSLARDLIQVLTPDKKTVDVPLGPQGLTIGRDEDNEIVLEDQQASRHHARVEFAGSEVRITDLNSTNGTYMENVRLLPGVQEPWSEDKGLRIGKTWLRLRRGVSISGGTQPQPRYGAAAGGIGAARPGPGGTQLEPGSVHTSGDSGRVDVTVPSAQITVEPGASANLPITLQNQGALVDRFTITVKGVPGTWLPEPVKVVPMMPGDQKEVTLVIRPPRSPQSRAGRHALVLQVASQQSAGQPVEVRMTLTVGAYSEFSSEMRPSKIRPGQASRLLVRNKGNAQGSFTVQWKDRGDELAFKPTQAKLRIPEDRDGEVIFVAAPRHRRLIGAEKSYTFTAQVLADNGENQVHNGELVSKPPLPAWVLSLPLVGCLLLGMAGAFLWNQENDRIAGQTATILAVEGRAATQVESIIRTQTFDATSIIGANQATIQAATSTAVWLLADDDRDGLTNGQELELNTLPNKRDTDEDGLDDGDEVNVYNTDPLRPDTDGDGLKDGTEVAMGLDPNNPDTDGDGIPDAQDPDPKYTPTGTPTPTATATPTATITPSPTSIPTITPTIGGFVLTPGIFEPPILITAIFPVGP